MAMNVGSLVFGAEIDDADQAKKDLTSLEQKFKNAGREAEKSANRFSNLSSELNETASEGRVASDAIRDAEEDAELLGKELAQIDSAQVGAAGGGAAAGAGDGGLGIESASNLLQILGLTGLGATVSSAISSAFSGSIVASALSGISLSTLSVASVGAVSIAAAYGLGMRFRENFGTQVPQRDKARQSPGSGSFTPQGYGTTFQDDFTTTREARQNNGAFGFNIVGGEQATTVQPINSSVTNQNTASGRQTTNQDVTINNDMTVETNPDGSLTASARRRLRDEMIDEQLDEMSRNP